MSKVHSKKTREDLAQNTEALQSFKVQVLDKLSPPSKSKKAESLPEQIKVRSYNPDGDTKEEPTDNIQNKQILPEPVQITEPTSNTAVTPSTQTEDDKPL